MMSRGVLAPVVPVPVIGAGVGRSPVPLLSTPSAPSLAALPFLPVDIDPVFVAMLLLRVAIVIVVVGVIVKGYLRRRRNREEIIRESQEWMDEDEEERRGER